MFLKKFSMGSKCQQNVTFFKVSENESSNFHLNVRRLVVVSLCEGEKGVAGPNI